MFLAKPSEGTELCFGKHTQLHKFIKSFQRLLCPRPKGEKKSRGGCKREQAPQCISPRSQASSSWADLLPAAAAHHPSPLPSAAHGLQATSPGKRLCKNQLDARVRRERGARCWMRPHPLQIQPWLPRTTSPPGSLPALFLWINLCRLG